MKEIKVILVYTVIHFIGVLYNTTENDFEIGNYLNEEQYDKWKNEYGV